MERARSLWRRGESRITRVKDETSTVNDFTLRQTAKVQGNQLLLEHGYDPEYWEIVDSSCVKRANSIQSRVKVRPKLNLEETRTTLSEALSKVLGTYTKVHCSEPYNETMVVIPLYDLHLGRLFEGKDHNTTRATLMEAIEDVCYYLEDFPPEKIVLPIGQDFLNADNPIGSTTKGTLQDNSLSWYDMLSEGIGLAITVIERMADIAPVEVYYSMGNHDEVLSYAIVKALYQRYITSKRVVVDDSMAHRVYLTYGNNLVGLSHGKEEHSLLHCDATGAKRGVG